MHTTFEISEDTDVRTLNAIISYCISLGGGSGATLPAPVDTVPSFGQTAIPEEPALPEDEIPDHPAPGQTTDVHGLPWDARVHSANRGLNKDGSWRYKKGVDTVTKAAVENE